MLIFNSSIFNMLINIFIFFFHIIYSHSLCIQLNCLLCFINQCQFCLPSYYLHNSLCYPCPSNCILCNQFQCKSCNRGYILISKTCVSCVNNCLNCSSIATCTSCITSYQLLSDHTCSMNKCNVSNCINCTDYDINSCVNCLNGYQLNIISNRSNCIVFSDKMSSITLGLEIGIPFMIIVVTIIYCKLKRRNNNINNRVVAENFDLNKIDTVKEEQLVLEGNKQEVCPICLQTNCNLLTQCNHLFHFECFLNAIIKIKYCALCRSSNIRYFYAVCTKCKKKQKWNIENLKNHQNTKLIKCNCLQDFDLRSYDRLR